MSFTPAMRPARSICAACSRQQRIITHRRFTTSRALHFEDQNSRLPRIANPSLWSALIPKYFRRTTDPTEAAERAALKVSSTPRQWNPYTIFIILGILVGSNAIQLIALRNEMLNFSRKTDAKLALLREVVQRVKSGEDVDVKRLLGTGDPEKEGEWEEVVRELETADMVWEGKRKREVKMKEKAEGRRRKEEEERAAAAAREGEGLGLDRTAADGAGEAERRKRPKFIM